MPVTPLIQLINDFIKNLKPDIEYSEKFLEVNFENIVEIIFRFNATFNEKIN